MWLFRRDPKELDKEERERLALLFECAPDLKRAYDLREKLTCAFETDHTKETGTAAIKHKIWGVPREFLKSHISLILF